MHLIGHLLIYTKPEYHHQPSSYQIYGGVLKALYMDGGESAHADWALPAHLCVLRTDRVCDIYQLVLRCGDLDIGSGLYYLTFCDTD